MGSPWLRVEPDAELCREPDATELKPDAAEPNQNEDAALPVDPPPYEPVLLPAPSGCLIEAPWLVDGVHGAS
eukprot:COSAG01_NODE_54134_length_334_cov_0.800000_1_plen_71_part_10